MPTVDSLTRSPINHGFLFRPSNARDAADAAHLIYLAWGVASHYFFCQPDAARTEAFLAALHAQRGHRYSHQFGTLALGSTGPAGLLLAVPGTHLLRLTWTLIPLVMRHSGVAAGARFALRWWPFLLRAESARDELYIDTVSVEPAWRGRGMGTALMAEAEQEAHRLGLNACSLSVDLTNHRARDLYERLGYRSTAIVAHTQYMRAIHYEGFHHMVKPLAGQKV